MSGKLSTHVLDLTTGRPAAGMKIELFGSGGALLKTTSTNHDGRTDAPLLAPGELVAGEYEIVFHVGSFFAQPDAFLDRVPIRFRITDPVENFHVPLLCTPWAYSTYRGS